MIFTSKLVHITSRILSDFSCDPLVLENIFFFGNIMPQYQPTITELRLNIFF